VLDINPELMLVIENFLHIHLIFVGTHNFHNGIYLLTQLIFLFNF